MQIESSVVQFRSEHTSISKDVREESLQITLGPPADEQRERGAVGGARVSLSSAARAAQPVKQPVDEAMGMDLEAQFEVTLLRLIIERLTGRELKLFSPGEFKQAMAEAEAQAQGVAQEVAATPTPQSAGYSLEYDYYASHYEYESTSFSAEGMVRTTDGREIGFAVDLSMTREFFSEERLSIRAGDAARKLKDPLVINFGGTAAQFTRDRFSFDLDLDGRDDQVAFVGSGSGFLGLDRNADGVINDGSELFGPRTGSGFAELAAYDQDGNQFIDEGDDIYDKLRIWSKDGAGNDLLVGLGERNVGAIYLGHLATPFDVKDNANVIQAQFQSSGIYLREDGGVGTVQEVDLAV